MAGLGLGMVRSATARHAVRCGVRFLGGSGRGFPSGEFEARLERARSLMEMHSMDALWFSGEANIRYFTGVESEFWISPTRPVFLVLPRDAGSAPIGVVPEIWGPAMRRTFVEDVRTWPAPRPEDDGISLLVGALASVPAKFGTVGCGMGLESAPRMPSSSFDAVWRKLADAGDETAPGVTIDMADASPLIAALRGVKSPAEIAKIGRICAIGSAAYAALPARLEAAHARLGGVLTERDVAREMRIELLERGADTVPYVVATAGAPSYESVVAAPSDAPLAAGQVLAVDVGARLDGYYCDFDRNFCCGPDLDPAAAAAHARLHDATDAALALLRPGARFADLFEAMRAELPDSDDTGRYGHAFGLSLTELPSITRNANAVLEEGNVLAIEPSTRLGPSGPRAGVELVHEENVAITADGYALLTDRAPREMVALPFLE